MTADLFNKDDLKNILTLNFKRSSQISL